MTERPWNRPTTVLYFALSALVGCSSSAGSGDAPDASFDALVPQDARALDGRPAAHKDASFDAKADAMRAPHDGSVDARDGAHPTDATPAVDASDAGVDAGVCQSDASCGAGQTCCELCVDITTDINNCGACFSECDESATCDVGACVVTSCSGHEDWACLLAPGVHGTCCGGACQAIDIKSDPNNCGGCGIVCPTGSTCDPVGGQSCVVSDGGTSFCQAGASTGCPVGDVCAPDETYCLATSCPAGSDGDPCGIPGATGATGTCCNQACVNVAADGNNCGACGTVCASGTFCDGACTTTPSCATAATGTACPAAPGVVGACCEGACVDHASDSSNCGACGNICPSGSTCGGFQCTGGDGGVVSCQSPGSCPAGDVCYQGFCVVEACTAADEGAACAFGPNAQGTCCGGACVSTTSDPTNCGACGKVCHSGICSGSFGQGQCLPEGPCATVCGMGTECVGRECVPATCEGPPGSACYVPSDGAAGACCFSGFGTTCADIGSDPENCGGCGNVCPLGQTCSAGVCSGTSAPCGAGKVGAYCDLAAGLSHLCCSGTGCVDIESDPQNCGYCGDVCPTGLSCSGGHCAAVTCTAATEGESCVTSGPFSYSDVCCHGACVDTSTSASNCGGCGSACAGAETCADGACGVDACSGATVGDPCHLSGGTGLCCASGCVDTTGDSSNCGGCGLACAAGAACVESACH